MKTTKKIFNTYLDCNIKKNNFPSLKNPFHDEKKEKKNQVEILFSLRQAGNPYLILTQGNFEPPPKLPFSNLVKSMHHYLFVICNLRVQLSSDLVLDFLLWFFLTYLPSLKKKIIYQIMGLITIKTSPMGNYQLPTLQPQTSASTKR